MLAQQKSPRASQQKLDNSSGGGKFMKDHKGQITHSNVVHGTPLIAGFFAAQAKSIPTQNCFEGLEEDMQLA